MCRFRFAEWASVTEQRRCRFYLFEKKRIYGLFSISGCIVSEHNLYVCPIAEQMACAAPVA
jgi:hypothetical protein